MNDLIYYCPKCQSEDIDFFEINEPISIRVSMDDLTKELETTVRNAVMTVTHYDVICKGCGYVIKYTR